MTRLATNSWLVLQFCLVVCVVALSSCSKLPEEEFKLKSTELIVRVLDASLRPVNRGNVSLYLDIVSFRTRSGAVATSEIAADGYARFTDLQPANYFIYAAYEIDGRYYDNESSSYDLADYLTENAVTTITLRTELRREGPVTRLEVRSIEVIPISQNIAYAGPDFDTLRGDFMLIKDYDGGLISNQQIIGRSTFELYKKPVFGEILRFPLVSPVAGGPVEISVEGLAANSGLPPAPGTHTYTLYMSCFTSKRSFDLREDFYDGTSGESQQCTVEIIDVGSQYLNNMTQLHPYTTYVFAEETRLQRFNYDIYSDVAWK